MGLPLPPTYIVSFRFRRILVPVDGSENSFRALELAIDFAQRYGSKVVAIHAKPKGTETQVPEELRRRFKKHYILIDFKIKEYDPLKSSPANEILNEIFEGSYDAVILGARGTTVNENIQLGSVASAVVFNAPITVVIVR
ncbi:MAG: universal stress protein [Thermoprotei archaeon]|nr:MAG: universal stress protein [Thermoprotei archaeon]